MVLFGWLVRLRQRVHLNRRALRHVAARRRSQISETLEKRTLLAVTGFFISGELTIASDAGDSISIGSDPEDCRSLTDGLNAAFHVLNPGQVFRVGKTGR